MFYSLIILVLFLSKKFNVTEDIYQLHEAFLCLFPVVLFNFTSCNDLATSLKFMLLCLVLQCYQRANQLLVYSRSQLDHLSLAT